MLLNIAAASGLLAIQNILFLDKEIYAKDPGGLLKKILSGIGESPLAISEPHSFSEPYLPELSCSFSPWGLKRILCRRPAGWLDRWRQVVEKRVKPDAKGNWPVRKERWPSNSNAWSQATR